LVTVNLVLQPLPGIPFRWATQTGQGITTTCGGPQIDFQLQCAGNLWLLNSTVCGTNANPEVGFTCDPFELDFNILPCAGAPCTGTLSVTVTT
jgi:hypothetical protein